jgi:hypothetical protein
MLVEGTLDSHAHLMASSGVSNDTKKPSPVVRTTTPRSVQRSRLEY